MVDAKTRDRYKRFKIDLAGSSGRTHNILPVPAALLIDTDGVVHFSYANPNYRVRVSPAIILAAAREMLKKTLPVKRTR